MKTGNNHKCFSYKQVLVPVIEKKERPAKICVSYDTQFISVVVIRPG